MKNLIPAFKFMAIFWPIITSMCLYARAQQPETFTVTGKVISAASGVAIEGATITNKRTRIHAVTDRLGEYRIPARPDGILVYSFIGYVTAEEEIGGREKIIVALDSAENTLEEVEINAGYYTTTRRTSTGNISRVTNETIEKQVVTNPLSAMQGRMAGVEILQASGVPGGRFLINIRGAGSIASGNEPLYLIDGIPLIENRSSATGTIIGVGNLLDVISPADIETIEVLKDADATAIYGSRGANGVVLITTKKGKPGNTELNLSVETGVASVANFVDLLNTNDYLTMRREAFENDEASPTVNNAYDLLLWEQNRYTDWQKELIGGSASTANAQIALRGGNSNTNFVISGNYQREGNVYPGSGSYIKGSGHFNINHKLAGDRLLLNLGSTYGIRRQDQPQIDLTRFALKLPPNAPAPLEGNGDLKWDGWLNADGNPFQYLERRYLSHTNSLNAHASFDYSIFKDIKMVLRGGYSIVDLQEQLLTPPSSLNPDPARGQSSLSANILPSNVATTWSVEPMLHGKHRMLNGVISAMFGITLQESISSGQELTGTGYVDDLLISNLASANQILGSTSYSEYKYAAFFTRLNYNHANRYIVNITARRDGSSRFGPDRKWGDFGAIGFAWVFSEEPFIDNIHWLEIGKIRASYGITGNDQIGNYGYLSTYRPNNFYPYQINTMQPLRLANSLYGWESNRKMEFGLELGLIKNKLNLEFAWYRNRSDNQLIGLSLPATAGFPSIQANFPALVQNTGVEVLINLPELRIGSLQYGTSINFSRNVRKLMEFPEIDSYPSYRSQYQVGEPMNASLMYRYIGVDGQSGVYGVDDMAGNNTFSLLEDGRWIVPRQPFRVGLAGQLKLGGLQIDFFLRWQHRQANHPRTMYGMPGLMANQPEEVMQRWTDKSGQAMVQRFSMGRANANFNRFIASDGNLIGASYVRLQNVSISYLVPSEFSRVLGIQTARCYVHGQNLLTSSRKYPWLDPEISGPVLPPLRYFSVGFQINI